MIKSEYILEPWVNHILQNPLLTSDKCLEMWAVILQCLFVALGAIGLTVLPQLLLLLGKCLPELG